CHSGSELKRNFVVVRLAGLRLWWWSCFCRSRFAAFACGACAGRSTTEKLHRLTDHAQFAALLPALFIVPGVELETAFYENWTALLQIFAGDFREPRP